MFKESPEKYYVLGGVNKNGNLVCRAVYSTTIINYLNRQRDPSVYSVFLWHKGDVVEIPGDVFLKTVKDKLWGYRWQERLI